MADFQELPDQLMTMRVEPRCRVNVGDATHIAIKMAGREKECDSDFWDKCSELSVDELVMLSMNEEFRLAELAVLWNRCVKLIPTKRVFERKIEQEQPPSLREFFILKLMTNFGELTASGMEMAAGFTTLRKCLDFIVKLEQMKNEEKEEEKVGSLQSACITSMLERVFNHIMSFIKDPHQPGRDYYLEPAPFEDTAFKCLEVATFKTKYAKDVLFVNYCGLPSVLLRCFEEEEYPSFLLSPELDSVEPSNFSMALNELENDWVFKNAMRAVPKYKFQRAISCKGFYDQPKTVERLNYLFELNIGGRRYNEVLDLEMFPDVE